MHAQSFRKCLLAFCGKQQRGQRGATGGSTYSASASHIGGLTKVARSQYKVFEIVFQGSKLLVLFMETEELDFTQLKCEMGMLCQTLPLFEAYGVFSTPSTVEMVNLWDLAKIREYVEESMF